MPLASRVEPASATRTVGPAVAVAVAAVLVAGTALGGYLLSRSGVDLHLGSTRPVGGHYRAHLTGWLLPAAFVALVGVHSGQRWAATLPWRRLLLASWAGTVAWAVTLALVGGGPRALGAPLTSRHEYLAEVARADAMGIGGFLREFAVYIVDTPPVWTTHVAGHPPLATLVFVLLHRIGLGGPTPAALLCVAVGACAVPAVLDSVRRRGSEGIARRAAPFLVLAPTALWVATSADALFAGVAAVGLWLLVSAGGPARAVLGGAVLGATLFLSYGLVLLAPLALVAAWRGRETARVVGPALAGVAVVVAGFALAGFVWWEGLAATARRVVLGAGHRDRPGWFFLFGNVAASAVAVGPATVGALARWRPAPWLWFPGAALLAMTVATASQLSVGEVERIYLPFTVWLLPLAALLPSGRRWLAASAGWAFLIAMTTELAW
ncbi:hypothetical protein Val02_07380 [Virgisporangium aliadipatigenens]|uniref:Integral membrane protein n=1 Tax=Virgisporangium aliadipatigenens TaxID=741659 RepID=A0A8J3YGJ9_9ACTN|nr:hypothetical protein [Virgisporangium aliadipatigenens]GIJ43852.1 hypothetical protein Val02_07380 [Virgisporangium aliadipatigenens]